MQTRRDFVSYTVATPVMATRAHRQQRSARAGVRGRRRAHDVGAGLWSCGERAAGGNSRAMQWALACLVRRDATPPACWRVARGIKRTRRSDCVPWSSIRHRSVSVRGTVGICLHLSWDASSVRARADHQTPTRNRTGRRSRKSQVQRGSPSHRSWVGRGARGLRSTPRPYARAQPRMD